MTTVYFRVDANSDIATGHIMRCLSIARACVQAGRERTQLVQISFLTSDSESRSLLEGRFEKLNEFPIHCLNSDYRHIETEVSDLLAYITAEADSDISLTSDTACEKPWLFVDSYFVSPNYFHMLSGHCKIAYLDDLRKFDCPVDLLINYDTELDCPCYARAAHKLLGIRYTPLRTQFQSPAYQVRPEAAHVFVSTGGTDPYGIAEYLLRTIYDCKPCLNTQMVNNTCLSEYPDMSRLQSLHYHIVTSRANPRYVNLTDMAADNPHILIYENVTDMASLMASCDLAVSAGGTTLSELCAVGVPAISYLMADNQRTAVESFAVKGIIPFAGDIRPAQKHDFADQDFESVKIGTTKEIPSVSVINNILQFMTNMSENMEMRQKSSHDMRALLDGCGARRIADALLAPS